MSCWSCGGIKVHNFFRELEVPYAELKPLLADITTEDLPPEIDKRGKLELPEKLGPLLKPHRRFLERRKLDPDEIQETWKIQGIGHADYLFWRIFIPIHFKTEVVSWTTRSVADKARLRYVSAKPEQERYNHKVLLYGEQLCGNSCIVTEGPTDVWRVGPGSVCTFGTAYKKEQVARIAAFAVRAIWFDSAAIHKAEKLATELEVLPGTTYLVQSTAKDPGSAPLKEIKEIRKLLK